MSNINSKSKDLYGKPNALNSCLKHKFPLFDYYNLSQYFNSCIMIQRRIINHIQNGTPINLQDQNQLITYLSTHFIHQYYTPVNFKELLPHLKVHQYLINEEVFIEGDPIQHYYFLVMGRVITIRSQKSGEDERCLIDGPSIIGQSFHMNCPMRQQTVKIISPQALVLYFDRQALQVQLVKQQQQFQYILHEIRLFCSCPKQALQNKKIHSFVHIEKYRLNEQIPIKAKTTYLLIQGQCKISNKKKEVIVSRFDCLAVERYFDPTAQQYSYTSYSTQLVLLALDYEIIAELNPSLLQRFQFLYRTHLITLQVKELPRLERQTNKENRHMMETTNQFRHRSTHHPTKSKSFVGLNETINMELNRFRKQFVLGFSEQQAINNSQIYKSNKRSQQPKGYFQLKTQQNIQPPKQMARREWAHYIHTKSSQRQKMKSKGNLKPKFQVKLKCSPTKQQQTFKMIFSKYNSLPSIGQSKQATIKLAKSSKLKQLTFIRNNK